MVSGTHPGDWWIPGQKRHSGQLIVDEKNESIELHVYGVNYIDGTTIDFFKTDPIDFHQIIFGERTFCTLFNCHWTGTEEIGNHLFKTIYRIEYVFTGVHIVSTKNPVIGATFIFPHLSSWFDGHEMTEKLRGKKDYFVNGKEEIQNSLKDETAEINNNLSINFYDKVDERTEKMHVSYRVEYSKLTRFQYKEAVSFSELLNDAINFVRLLSFCFGKPLNLNIIYVYKKNNDFKRDRHIAVEIEEEFSIIRVKNYTLKNKKEIATHSYHSRNLLLSRHCCSNEELEKVIMKWFANKHLYNIYEYYLDSNDWLEGTGAHLSNIMFNNRFLNLIQGLEDYYRQHFEGQKTMADKLAFDEKKRKVLADIENPELKQWLNNTFKFTKTPSLAEKLNTIVIECNHEMAQLLEDLSIADFPKSAADFRNQLSHGKNKEIYLGQRLHRDYFIAQLLLGVCILRTLEVEDINSKIAHYSKFIEAAREIAFFTESNN